MVNHSVSKLRCWQEVLTEAGSLGDVVFSMECAVFCMYSWLVTWVQRGGLGVLSGYTR